MSSAVILIGSRLVMSSMGGSLEVFSPLYRFHCRAAPRPGERSVKSAAPAGTLLRRRRHVADVFRHFVALLHRRALGDRNVPALDVRILIEVDGLPFEPRHPRPDGDVGNRILVG